MKKVKITLLSFLSVLLVACGGGGGSSSENNATTNSSSNNSSEVIENSIPKNEKKLIDNTQEAFTLPNIKNSEDNPLKEIDRLK